MIRQQAVGQDRPVEAAADLPEDGQESLGVFGVVKQPAAAQGLGSETLGADVVERAGKLDALGPCHAPTLTGPIRVGQGLTLWISSPVQDPTLTQQSPASGEGAKQGSGHRLRKIVPCDFGWAGGGLAEFAVACDTIPVPRQRLRAREACVMLGAIAGDVIGSVFERRNLKSKDFPLFSRASQFTDDSVLTAAVADCLLHGRDYAEAFRAFYRWYPRAGYGFLFANWARNPQEEAYGSFGNGSAMRVSPVAWAHETLDEVLSEAAASAAVTHNSVDGIKGAQAVAAATFLARTGKSKGAILSAILDRFRYDLDFTLDDIRAHYRFDATCQGTVPQALVAFRDSTDFEDAIRSAISIGGDSDTLACMAGSIAAAYYGGVPSTIEAPVRDRLDERLNGILDLFERRFL